MKATVSFLVIAFATVAFSGCLVDNGTAKTTEPTTTGSASPTGTSSAMNMSGPPPVAIIDVRTADATLNGTTFNATAGANLTFDASNSTGSNLSFAWDFGDNATSDNATAVHAFAKAGAYNVTLTVTDDASRNNTAEVHVRIAPSGPASGTLIGSDKKTFSGTVVVGTQGASGCGTAGQASVDQPKFTWEILAALNGTTAVVKHVKITMTGGTTNVDSDLFLLDPSGKVLGSGTGSSAAETVEVSQLLAPGKYTIRVDGCVAVAGSVSITAIADYTVP